MGVSSSSSLVYVPAKPLPPFCSVVGSKRYLASNANDHAMVCEDILLILLQLLLKINPERLGGMPPSDHFADLLSERATCTGSKVNSLKLLHPKSLK